MRIIRIFFSLEGRINRLEFWLAFLGLIIFTTLMLIIASSLPASTVQSARVVRGLFYGLWLAAFLWMLIAVSSKRWHDMNQSGLMSLLWLIPFAGPLIVISWLGFGPSQSQRRRRR